jgi:hypothetical protein
MRQQKDDDGRYRDNGYKDRDDYLNTLADDYGLDSYVVHELAGMLGPSEDFDGLISDLEDFESMGMLEDFRKETPEEAQDPCEMGEEKPCPTKSA